MTPVKLEALGERHVAELVALYQREWWTVGRTREDVEVMLAHSWPVFAYADADGALAAFARVLTDRVYKALVLDVIVRADLRGTGLGATLMDDVLRHPALARVRHFELYCLPEMVEFYGRWGFDTDTRGTLFMRREA